jgi:hypothetical protein
MPTMVALSKLVFDPSLYPRQNIDEVNVNELVRALEGGIRLPPITVEKKRMRIVDGVHRYTAASRAGSKQIEADFRSYKDDTELFREAVLLNSATGLKLGVDDKLKVIMVGENLGLKEIDLATILRTSQAYIHALKPRYAKLSGKLEKIPLKAPVRHLSGQTLSADQKTAIERGPGTSYLLLVRQLCDAIEFELLPDAKQHPTLWSELKRLKKLLDGIV